MTVATTTSKRRRGEGGGRIVESTVEYGIKTALSPNKQLQLHKKRLENAIRTYDVQKLIQYSTTKHAYVNNEYRRQIYTILLKHKFPFIGTNDISICNNNNNNCSNVGTSDATSHTIVTNDEDIGLVNNLEKNIFQHPYVDQVEKDINRSLYKFVSDLERGYLRTQLSQLVNSILSYPIVLSSHWMQEEEEEETNIEKSGKEQLFFPHYYQGFHELCSIFMLSLGTDFTHDLFTKYLIPHKTYLRLCMEKPVLDPVLKQLKSIYSILYNIGEEQYALYLKECQVDEGHYALSWILTWYCHVVDDLHVVQKLLDAIMAHGSEFCIYIAVSIVLYKKNDVMYREEDDNNDGNSDHNYDNTSHSRNDRKISKPDFAQVHTILSRIPHEWCTQLYDEKRTVWDYIIERALEIREIQERKSKERINISSSRSKRWLLWSTVVLTVGISGALYYANQQLYNYY
jgi:hypothetical protein